MSDEALIEAIHDLTRAIIAFNFDGAKYEAVRRLHFAGVKQSRIAVLLDMPLKDVTSFVAKLRKAGKKVSRKDGKRA